MAYLDEDILYNNIEEKYKVAQGEARKAYSDVLDTICEMPRADVVPKREVFLASSDAMKMLIECHGYALTHDADIKKEVAREIFEEIERLLSMHFCSCLPKDATEHYDYYEGDLADAVAELKKKYTEDQSNG